VLVAHIFLGFADLRVAGRDYCCSSYYQNQWPELSGSGGEYPLRQSRRVLPPYPRRLLGEYPLRQSRRVLPPYPLRLPIWGVPQFFRASYLNQPFAIWAILSMTLVVAGAFLYFWFWCFLPIAENRELITNFARTECSLSIPHRNFSLNHEVIEIISGGASSVLRW